MQDQCPEPSSFHDALLERARGISHHRHEYEQLAANLPAEDESLDQVLREAEDQRDETSFTRLWIAALLANRRPSASLLVKGAELFRDAILIGASTFRCSGDLASALIEAVQRGRMGNERVGFALLSAAMWLKREKHGEYPRDLIREARKLARISARNRIVYLLLRDFVLVTANQEVADILGIPSNDEYAEDTFIESVTEMAERDPWRVIFRESEKKEVVLHSGYTVRRAVPKHGRNEPCPCGSGKKYKKCCLKKDEERLRNSSDIPGVTRQEIKQQPETFLTVERLSTMRAHELVKLNVSDLPPNLHHVLFNRLLLFHEFERMIEILQTHLDGEQLDVWWHETLFTASVDKRRDIVESLLDFSLVEAPDFDSKRIPLGAQLILARRRGEHVIELLEDRFKSLLLQEEDELFYADWEGWASDLLDSDYPALGIAVARGAYVICDSGMLLESIEQARDHLDLSPSDPIESKIDPVPFPELRADNHDDKKLRQAKDEIGEKSRQLDQLKKELSTIRERLAQADAEPSNQTAAAETGDQRPLQATPAATDDSAQNELAQMRQRFKQVKEDLKARHRERNELRKELRGAMEELEQSQAALRAAREQDEDGADDDEREEASLTRETFADTEQPWRIPVYSQRFRDDLEKLPPHVVRHALQTSGDLAAGLPQAYSQVRKLKAAPSLLRARVGLGHRLLFRIQDQQIEFVAAIPRKDLEGFIKHFRH